jgi:hypothetical protein
VQVRFSNVMYEVFMQRKTGKVPENWKIFFCDGYAFVLLVMTVKKFSGKKNRDNYKGKSKNSSKLQLYAFSIITDHRNDIFD